MHENSTWKASFDLPAGTHQFTFFVLLPNLIEAPQARRGNVDLCGICWSIVPYAVVDTNLTDKRRILANAPTSDLGEPFFPSSLRKSFFNGNSSNLTTHLTAKTRYNTQHGTGHSPMSAKVERWISLVLRDGASHVSFARLSGKAVTYFLQNFDIRR